MKTKCPHLTGVTKEAERSSEEKGCPKKDMFNEPCRSCGVLFYNYGGSFTFEKGKKPICFGCEIKRLPKKRV